MASEKLPSVSCPVGLVTREIRECDSRAERGVPAIVHKQGTGRGVGLRYDGRCAGGARGSQDPLDVGRDRKLAEPA